MVKPLTETSKQIIENNDNQSAHLHHVPSHAVVLSYPASPGTVCDKLRQEAAFEDESHAAVLWSLAPAKQQNTLFDQVVQHACIRAHMSTAQSKT
jgi:hypothetical protein